MGAVDWVRGNADLAAFLRRFVFTTQEPRVGEWTNNPTWGRMFTGVMPTQSGTTFSVATGSQLPGPPRMHTIQLFRNDVRAANNADVYAKVSYGVGGANNSFLLDWSAGAQFSMTANSVRVDAVTYAPDGGTAYTPSAAQLILGATIGQGSIGHGPVLTLTEATKVINAGAGFQWAIPPFARAVIVRTSDLTNPAPAQRYNVDPTRKTLAIVSGLNNGGQALASVDAQLFAGACGALGWPLPGGSTFLEVLNQSNFGVAPDPVNVQYRVTVQWVLSL